MCGTNYKKTPYYITTGVSSNTTNMDPFCIDIKLNRHLSEYTQEEESKHNERNTRQRFVMSVIILEHRILLIHQAGYEVPLLLSMKIDARVRKMI
ncbi:MAG TPA: hypothetical protein DCZ04_17720 [Syntrophorhabdus aromaticivorans]|nr:hypothetical protein [Syntrophorhabdus aromaticivorans]